MPRVGAQQQGRALARPGVAARVAVREPAAKAGLAQAQPAEVAGQLAGPAGQLVEPGPVARVGLVQAQLAQGQLAQGQGSPGACRLRGPGNPCRRAR